MRITPKIQQQLHELLRSQEFVIRYEKGNFKGGYCVVMDQRMIIINKFYPLETKINTLVEIINSIELNEEAVPEELHTLLKKVREAS